MNYETMSRVGSLKNDRRRLYFYVLMDGLWLERVYVLAILVLDVYYRYESTADIDVVN